MDPQLLIVVLFAVIALAVAAMALVVRDLVYAPRAAVDRRVGEGREALLQRLRLPAEPAPATSLSGAIDLSFGKLITESGLDLAPEAAFLAQVLCGLTVGGALFVWRDDLPTAIGGFAAGVAVAFAFFVYRRAAWQRAIRDQVPDAMNTIARAVRSGESLDQAIVLAGETVPAPLGREFVRAAKQLEMGLSMEATMRALVRRAPITELRILAATFTIQRQTGGSLPVTLDRLSAVVRDRISYQRQFRAATAGGRSGTILIALSAPFVAAFMFIFQPDYIGRFTQVPPGGTMLVAAIVLQVVGLIWISRLVRTDY